MKFASTAVIMPFSTLKASRKLHVWGSRAEHLDQPDVIVFDLDPAEDVPWREVAAAALEEVVPTPI